MVAGKRVSATGEFGKFPPKAKFIIPIPPDLILIPFYSVKMVSGKAFFLQDINGKPTIKMRNNCTTDNCFGDNNMPFNI